MKYLGKNALAKGIVTLEDFRRVFVRCLFKDALLGLSEAIDQTPGIDKATPLAIKLGIY